SKVTHCTTRCSASSACAESGSASSSSGRGQAWLTLAQEEGKSLPPAFVLRRVEGMKNEQAISEYIVELGIPEEWMHEALALYHEYYGDKQGALENLIQCGNWKKAHTIFVTSVAHSMFLSSNHQEVWRITSALENHKYEIADWDLGAGIYIDFYVLKNSMQERNAMDDSGSLEEMSESCGSFFGRLNESLLVWGSKLPVES
ncbi:hypothetical protein ACJX0J_011526, partial [Zea mays]